MASSGSIRRLTLSAALLATLLASLLLNAAVVAQEEESEETAPPVINLEIILDASGSMAEEIEPGVARIEAAKEVLHSIIDQIPPREGLNIGMRVYGHKGANNETGRAESCLSTELMVPVLGVDAAGLEAVVDQYEPVGWTPMTLALQSSELDFPEAIENQVNAVILMSDGLETCGGDPCAQASQLKNGTKAITTHVIGFALAEDEEEALQCVADEGGGILLGAGTAGELNEAMTMILADLDVLHTTGILELEDVAGVHPAAIATGGPAPSPLVPDPDVTSVDFSAANSREVPAGDYVVVWANSTGAEMALDVVVHPGETTLIRGSLIQLPISGPASYRVTAVDGTVVWEGPVADGDVVWVLPGTYRVEAVEFDTSTIILSMVVQTLPGSVTEVTATTK